MSKLMDDVDTEGYIIREIPYYISPLTFSQVKLDLYKMLGYRYDMTLSDFYRFGRERGLTATPLYRILGEFERKELIPTTGIFRIDTTIPTTIRTYIKRKYEPVELLPYTILERVSLMKLILTFSIETGGGHQPFFAEVTCDTILPSGIAPRSALEEEYIKRIVNCVLKLFWIHFDAYKVVMKGMDRLQKWVSYIINYGRELEEWNLDEFLEAVMDMIATRDLEEYVTKEAIITIGVEYESESDARFMYPKVHALIEKKKTGTWTIEKTLILADETEIWMDQILDIMVSTR